MQEYDINDFRKMSISSVYFNDEIKIKSIKNLEYEYIKLDNNVGYWITDCPFEDGSFIKYMEFVRSNPIWRMNNEYDLEDTNPFATIHLPDFSTRPLFNLLYQFYSLTIGYNKDVSVNDWGNIYFKEYSRPIKRWRLPHMDYVSGLVANLWFTNHNTNSTGTNLYFYKGVTHGINYDFQVNESHPLYKEWHNMKSKERDVKWNNFSIDEANYWGFELVGKAPTKYSCMTMYYPNISHAPFIEDDIKFRWSHTFSCFSNFL